MDPGPEGPTLYDRSFDLKLQLIQEGPKWPSMVVGLQDFLGTGVYSGEYFAATKSFLDGDLKVTGGFVWGRFGGVAGVRNPLCRNNNRFCTRTSEQGSGGLVDFGQFFSGEDIGFFGGVEFETPIRNLNVKAEYSSDDYDVEQDRGPFSRKIPFNFRAEYQVVEGVDVGAYYMYGSEIGVRLTLSGNPFQPPAVVDGEAAPQPLASRPEPPPAAEKALFGDIRNLLGDEPAIRGAGPGDSAARRPATGRGPGAGGRARRLHQYRRKLLATAGRFGQGVGGGRREGAAVPRADPRRAERDSLRHHRGDHRRRAHLSGAAGRQ